MCCLPECLGFSKSGLGHDEREDRSKEHQQNAAPEQRKPERCRCQQDADRSSDEGAALVELRSADEELGCLLLADLIGEPRDVRSAREREADAPHDLGQQDRNERRHRPLEGESGSDDGEARDHREATAQQIGDHPRGHLEQQRGRLQDAADEHEFQGIEASGQDSIQRRQHGEHREPRPEARLIDEPGRRSRETTTSGSGPGHGALRRSLALRSARDASPRDASRPGGVRRRSG